MDQKCESRTSPIGTEISISPSPIGDFHRPSAPSIELRPLDDPDLNVASHVASYSVPQHVSASNDSSNSKIIAMTTSTEKSDQDGNSSPENLLTSETEAIYLGKFRLSILFSSLCLSTLMISMHKTVVIPAMYSSSEHYILISAHG
jgi:hypothetical protein